MGYLFQSTVLSFYSDSIGDMHDSLRMSIIHFEFGIKYYILAPEYYILCDSIILGLYSFKTSMSTRSRKQEASNE